MAGRWERKRTLGFCALGSSSVTVLHRITRQIQSIEKHFQPGSGGDGSCIVKSQALLLHLRSQVFQAFVLRVHINLPRCCLGRCASCLRRTFGRRGVLFVGSVRFTLTTCTCCGSRQRRCCKCNLVQAESLSYW